MGVGDSSERRLSCYFLKNIISIRVTFENIMHSSRFACAGALLCLPISSHSGAAITSGGGVAGCGRGGLVARVLIGSSPAGTRGRFPCPLCFSANVIATALSHVRRSS